MSTKPKTLNETGTKEDENGTNEKFLNASLIHAIDNEDFGKVEPGNTNNPGLDNFFDNKPTKKSVPAPVAKKTAPALVAKKAAVREDSFSDEENSGEEEKSAAHPVTKPAAAKEERNSNSDDPKDEKPASKDTRPTAEPARKEERPDDNSADGSNDVKKPLAKKAKKPAPVGPLD